MPAKKRFLLRIDERLYAALERWAADELRSVNGQIEFLLQSATRKAGRLREPLLPPAPDDDDADHTDTPDHADNP